ncbi:MAG: class I SAM-dependent DNA methyltransferase [Lachnospiraceae bacterium]
MNSYTGFARVYETFMDNVPYDEWAKYLTGLLSEYGVKPGALIAELGCGTGSMTRRLARAGYDMIGIDLSEEMLDVARYEHEEENLDILYLHQDMREFELYGTVAAVVSLCDSMNYITSEEDLLSVFRLVNNYLDAGGYFIFDMNTVYKYETQLGDRVIAENRDDCSLIWENYYDAVSRINQYDITIYTKAEFEDEPAEDEDNLPPLYERLEETHLQKAYPVEEVIALLEQAGMEFVAVYGVGTREVPAPDCERVYFIAREKHQENKYYGEGCINQP